MCCLCYDVSTYCLGDEASSSFTCQGTSLFPSSFTSQHGHNPERTPWMPQLAPASEELMKILFNVETYKAAMMEFEINMAKMPLGKLSKSNIQKVIPSVHPHVIKDEDDFKLKVKMLETLQDIEIASRLLGFDVDNDDSLDDKYKKLQCEMVPLPHDSEDYQLVEKYLQTTHAPTYMDWALELEEVFTVERQGEFDKFVPYKNKLKNKILLWHASGDCTNAGTGRRKLGFLIIPSWQVKFERVGENGSLGCRELDAAEDCDLDCDEAANSSVFPLRVGMRGISGIWVLFDLAVYSSRLG
ncbi:unnamed protein product [Lactuca virosa]|uniref:Poly [ADP-ribose] polymerase n=1 Tax=Lactuca virosa TaxID=75947 RepID=A0AAU9PSQ8_9ASTR|nr:unnamed protein product [Lactuca virosa]